MTIEPLAPRTATFAGWEYMLCRYATGICDMAGILNDHGRHGWEAFRVDVKAGEYGSDDVYTLWFKRPRPS